MTFLPLYQQTVQGASPTVSGLLLTPLMVGSAITSIVAGQAVTKTGKYKMFPIIGGLVMAVGHVHAQQAGREHHAAGRPHSTTWSSASAWAS